MTAGGFGHEMTDLVEPYVSEAARKQTWGIWLDNGRQEPIPWVDGRPLNLMMIELLSKAVGLELKVNDFEPWPAWRWPEYVRPDWTVFVLGLRYAEYVHPPLRVNYHAWSAIRSEPICGPAVLLAQSRGTPLPLPLPVILDALSPISRGDRTRMNEAKLLPDMSRFIGRW